MSKKKRYAMVTFKRWYEMWRIRMGVKPTKKAPVEKKGVIEMILKVKDK